jgi:hypothetical protein
MNKMQPSPLLNILGTPLRQPVAPWGIPPINVENTKFFRSWLVYDSDFEISRTRGRVNWNVIAGGALAIIVSVIGWAGIAWLVAHFWK